LIEIAGWILGILVTGIPAAGMFLLGRRYARQDRAMLCSCGHGYGFHAVATPGSCQADVKRTARTGDGKRDQWVTCRCVRWDGPSHLEEFQRMVEDWRAPE
jgi:hypothetical protein